MHYDMSSILSCLSAWQAGFKHAHLCYSISGPYKNMHIFVLILANSAQNNRSRDQGQSPQVLHLANPVGLGRAAVRAIQRYSNSVNQE